MIGACVCALVTVPWMLLPRCAAALAADTRTIAAAVPAADVARLTRRARDDVIRLSK